MEKVLKSHGLDLLPQGIYCIMSGKFLLLQPSLLHLLLSHSLPHPLSLPLPSFLFCLSISSNIFQVLLSGKC